MSAFVVPTFDRRRPLHVCRLSPSLLHDAAAQGIVPQQFEPIVDVSALGTFLLISTVFGALIFRTRQVENAIQERNQALVELRVVKSKELTGDTDVQSVRNALNKYEEAVVQEERLRDVIPGVVRIVPPNADNAQEEEARTIAKQFLGKDYDIGAIKGEEGDGRVPMLALGVVGVLLLLYISLFAFMTLDPIEASSIIKDL